MKKGFKRFLCAFLAVLMLAATLPMGLSLPSFAAADGISFVQGNYYRIYSLDKPLASAPMTLFATVKVATDVAVPGVIFGNYKNATTSYINFEVFANGVPGLSFTNTEGTVTNVTFDTADIRTGDFVNVAIVFNAGTSVSLYLDGALVETKETTDTYAADAATASDFVVGGDSEDNGTIQIEDDNKSFFNGNIKYLALYSVALDETAVTDLNTNGINANAENLLACYDMVNSKQGCILDLSGNGCHASNFYKRATPLNDYAYSFAIVGDTQTSVHEDVSRAYTAWKNGTYDTLEEALAVQKRTSYVYNWLVDNKDSKKIEYVFGVGDITECRTKTIFESDGTSTWTWDNEFQHAKNQITKLDGAGIPYALVPGDHDESNRYSLAGTTGFYTNTGTRNYSKFASYFDELLSDRITGYYVDPAYPDSYSYYMNFEVGSTQYMLLALEVGAPNRVLDWANEVVAANPDRRVIVLTHSFLNDNGERIGTGDGGHGDGADGDNVRNHGVDMWDEFVKLHQNISFVISGHKATSNVVWRQDKGDNGNTVTQILVDPQYMDASYGMVCMLYFSEDGTDVQVEWISTGPNEFNVGYPYYGNEDGDYLYKTKNQFTFSVLEDGKSGLASYTDVNAILSNKKLYSGGATAGLILHTDFNKWTESDTRSGFGNAVYADTTRAVYGAADTFTYMNFSGKAINSGVYLEKDASGNQYVRTNGSVYQTIVVANAYDRAQAFNGAAKNYAGQTFVYQTDIKAESIGWNDSAGQGITVMTRATNGSAFTKSLVGFYKTGYMYGGNTDYGGVLTISGVGVLRDENGNPYRISEEEFTTIACMVNPQLNKYWVFVDGKVTNTAGYTFLTNAEMQTLVNVNGTDAAATYLYDEDAGTYLDKNGEVTETPVPYEYILTQVQFVTVGGNSVYYDNSMLYFVDQTFTYEDYLDMVTPVAGNTATMGSGEIGYNYYLNVSDTFLYENPNLEIKFEFNGKSQTYAVAAAEVMNKDIDSDGYADAWRKITCKVAAPEMTQNIKVTIYQGSTVYYSETTTLKAYVDNVISANRSEASVNAAKSMLAYGAYAQAYFQVDTSNPAIDVAEVELLDPSEVTANQITGTKFNYVSSTLALEAKTVIVHKFNSIEGLTFKLDGNEVKAVAVGNLYYVQIEVDAINLDTVYELEVSNGTDSYTISYSAVGYAKQIVDANLGNAALDNLVKALYTYNVYADEYSVS